MHTPFSRLHLTKVCLVDRVVQAPLIGGESVLRSPARTTPSRVCVSEAPKSMARAPGLGLGLVIHCAFRVGDFDTPSTARLQVD